MVYSPKPIVTIETFEDLRTYVDEELRSLARELGAAQSFLYLDPAARDLDKPRTGQMIYQDGTNFAPAGHGAGLVTWNGTAWVWQTRGDTPPAGDSSDKLATTNFVETHGAYGFFHIQRNADQTGLTAAAYNKISFNSEQRDDNSFFDSSTNFRYTPQQAGYYIVGASALLTYDSVANDAGQISVFKNNALQLSGNYFISSGNNTVCYSQLVGVMGMNGSSDFIDARAYVPSTNGTVKSNADATFFWGFKLRT